MPNPDVPLAGEVIEDEWGAAVVSRLVPIYADAPARDTDLPVPDDGQVVHAGDTFQIYGDGAWHDLATKVAGAGNGLKVTAGPVPADAALLVMQAEAGGRHYDWSRGASFANLELNAFDGGGGEKRALIVDESGNVYFEQSVSMGPVAAGDTMLELRPEGVPGRRYRLKRSDEFAQLELVSVETSSAEHIVFVVTDGGDFYLPHVASAAAASGTALGIGATGVIHKLSSSRRHKQDETPYDPAPGLADVGLKQWRYRADVAELGDDAPVRVSPIAEDIDAAGLPEFVNYDAEGRPDSLDIGSLALAQVAALQTRLATVETALAAMEEGP